MVSKYPDTKWINFDKLDYCAREHNIDTPNRKSRNYRFVEGDLLNEYLLLKILNVERVDAVIHFAAQSHVDNSFGNSIDFTLNNVLGTHKLLEACRIYGNVKRFIHISTDEVYGEVHDGDCHEHATLDPTNPYAASKAAAEFIVKSYYHSFKMPVIITRGNNVYGPRQYPEKVIPRFITLLSEGKRCTIQGSGECKRNFIYVDDTVTAIETILVHGVTDPDAGAVEVYNIGAGPDCEHSVLEIAEMLVKRLCCDDDAGTQDWKEKWIDWVPDRKFNDVRYSVNSDKLQSLGWRQRVTFEEGFERTVQWYLANKDHFDS